MILPNKKILFSFKVGQLGYIYILFFFVSKEHWLFCNVPVPSALRFEASIAHYSAFISWHSNLFVNIEASHFKMKMTF